jgi:hypothetical protein
MLLLIGNNKKSILNNRMLIYIQNRKNSKRKHCDFLCFISKMGKNIVMIDIKCFIISKLLLMLDNYCKMEGYHNLYILYIFLYVNMKKFEKMREKGNSNNSKFSFCIYICKQSILLVLFNFKCCYVVIVLPNCLMS